MGQITRVVFRRLFNTGNYENVAVEAEALVNESEDPAAVFAALRTFVEAQGPHKDRYGYWTYEPEEPGDVP